MQQLSQGLENPVQHKIAILLREQNVAGSNPVTPIAKQVSPALTSEPPTQGGFFVARKRRRSGSVTVLPKPNDITSMA